MPKAQLVAGPAEIYIATADPTEIPAAVGPLGTVPAGFSLLGDGYQNEDGVAVENDLTHEEEFIQNETNPIEAFLTQQALRVTCNVKDGTAELIALGMHQPTPAQNNPRVVELGAPHAVPKYQLYIIGNSPYERVRAGGTKWANFWFPEVYVMAFGPYGQTKRATAVALTFKALKDTDLDTVGKYLASV